MFLRRFTQRLQNSSEFTVLELDSHIVTNSCVVNLPKSRKKKNSIHSDHLKPSKLGWYIAKKLCLIFSYGHILRSQFWVHFQCILDHFCSKLSQNITIYVTSWCNTVLKCWKMVRDKIYMCFHHNRPAIRSCEYLVLTTRANSANTSGVIWKKSFERVINSFCCIFVENCIILACKKQDIQLLRVIFEIIDDFHFQEWTRAQATLHERPKRCLFI